MYIKVETACSGVVKAGILFLRRMLLAFQQSSSPIKDVRTGLSVFFESATIALAVSIGLEAP